MSFEEDFIFDSASVPERESFLSEGYHTGIIVNTEVKKVSTGRVVEVSIDINGKLIKKGMFIEHPNEKAVLYGCQNLRECFISVFGNDCKKKISELVNKQVGVLLERGPLKDGKSFMEVQSFCKIKENTTNLSAKTNNTVTQTQDDDVPF